MEKLQKLFLSLLFFSLLLSCKSDREQAESVYKRAIHYPQGSMMSINGIKRATEIDSTYPQAVYELSVAYLKRGLPHKWKPQYDKAVLLNPEERVPWRGYLYLWFYRDYKKAIADFDASDTLTPNFIDTPQAHSVDYWRGVSYLGLKAYEKSIAYFTKHIKQLTKESGEDWIETNAFLYRGIAYYEAEFLEKALKDFEKVLQYSNNRSADGKYYKALILKRLGENKKAAIWANDAIKDYEEGYYNQRPYVETLRQLYPEDFEVLFNQLNSEKN